MSSCVAFKTLWSDWQEGSLSEADNAAIVVHLEMCESCQVYHWQMKDMLNNLAELRKRPPISEEDKRRLFFKTYWRSGPSPNRLRQFSIAASVLAVAVSALLWATGGSRQAARDDSTFFTGRAHVDISLEEVQKIKLAFDSKKDIDNVTFTINLPRGVEISGFPEQQSLSWIGELRKGLNSLTLPLIAESIQPDDVVMAQIEYGNIRQKMELVLTQKRKIN